MSSKVMKIVWFVILLFNRQLGNYRAWHAEHAGKDSMERVYTNGSIQVGNQIAHIAKAHGEILFGMVINCFLI